MTHGNGGIDLVPFINSAVPTTVLDSLASSTATEFTRVVVLVWFSSFPTFGDYRVSSFGFIWDVFVSRMGDKRRHCVE